jgi:hypothetical protein
MFDGFYLYGSGGQTKGFSPVLVNIPNQTILAGSTEVAWSIFHFRPLLMAGLDEIGKIAKYLPGELNRCASSSYGSGEPDMTENISSVVKEKPNPMKARKNNWQSKSKAQNCSASIMHDGSKCIRMEQSER